MQPQSVNIDTREMITATNISADMKYIRTAGFSTIGDMGGALYSRAISEPEHPGKVQSADGTWWELATIDYSPFLFGASGSDQETTAVCSADNPTVILAEAKDFANGQKVSLEHAGQAASISTPSALTVSPTGLNRQGPTGNTVYSYRVAAVSENGEVSTASSAVTINNGHAQLGTITPNIRGLAFNVVRWETTAPGVAVWRSRAGGNYELIGVFGLGQADSIANGVMDSGLPQVIIPWVPASPPEMPLNARLVTSINEGGGATSLVLADAPSVSSISILIRHEDTEAINSYLSLTNHAKFPTGTFNVGSVTIPSSLSSLTGAGRYTCFKGWGARNAVIYASDNSHGLCIENITVHPTAWHNQMGVFLNGAISCVIRNCFLSGNLPIILANSSFCQIHNNTIEDWIDSGIFDIGGNANVIDNNIILQGCNAIPQNAAAIHTYNTSSNIISSNKTYGFHVYSVKCQNGNQNIVRDNYSANSWCEAYHFSGSVSGSRITGNTMFGGPYCMDYAISISNDHVDDAVMYANEISNNYIYQCGTAAIAVVEFGGANAKISYTVIKGNTVYGANSNQQTGMPEILINGSGVSNTYISDHHSFSHANCDYVVKEDDEIYGYPSNTQVGTIFGDGGFSGIALLPGHGSTRLIGGGTGI